MGENTHIFGKHEISLHEAPIQDIAYWIYVIPICCRFTFPKMGTSSVPCLFVGDLYHTGTKSQKLCLKSVVF